MRWWTLGLVALLSVASWWLFRGLVPELWAIGLALSLAGAGVLILQALTGIRRRALPGPRARFREELADTVRDPDSPRWRREQSLERLVALERLGALPLLDELFGDAPELRPAVVLAWGRLKHSEAVSRMARLITDSDERLGESIAEALGHFDSRASEEGLVRCLEHAERDVVWEAVDSLRQVGRERARKPLQALLEESREAGTTGAKLHGHVRRTLTAVHRRIAGGGSLSLTPRVAGALSTVGARSLPGGLSKAQKKRSAERPRGSEAILPAWVMFGLLMGAGGLFVFGGTWTLHCQRAEASEAPRCVRERSFFGYRVARTEPFSLVGARTAFSEDADGDVTYRVVLQTTEKELPLTLYSTSWGRGRMGRNVTAINAYVSGDSTAAGQWSQGSTVLTWFFLIIAMAGVEATRQHRPRSLPRMWTKAWESLNS